jgi:hypothetical protein
MKQLFLLVLMFVPKLFFAQETEVNPPFNIKTITFLQNGQNVIPLFQLGDNFQLQFDDLYGNEANYYYTITHCDYDWKVSQLSKNEYLDGFDNQRIIEYHNSLNTLQVYSHYKLSFPNQFNRFRVSGNYMINILNEDREVVFSRKIIIYENLVTVPMQVKRARDVANVNYKHNLDFTIKSRDFIFQSPLQNVKVLLLQNGNFKTGITNVKPMYTLGNDLIYKYDTETQFWAGNEYLYFENKNIRVANNNISYVDSSGGLYSCYLYRNNARANNPYTYWPDINGNFMINNLSGVDNEIEADYAWVYISLSAPSFFEDKNIYVSGMFNNNVLTDEYKLEFDTKKGTFEKAILIKQGFTNYKFTIADSKGKIDEEKAIDGNFYQTENNYDALIYYRENGQRYDRVIGRGIANSVDIIN